MSRQGSRGIAGPKGPPGKDGARISGWRIDAASYTVTPVMSDGGYGPPITLREMFQQFLTEAQL
jgi:hypothetical protein